MTTTITDPIEAAAELKRRVEKAGSMVFFGGAGVSTASGIPEEVRKGNQETAAAAVAAATGLPPVLASATFVSVLAGVVPAVAGCAVPGVVAVVGVAVPSAGFRATARSVSGSVPLASSKGSTPRKPMPAASRDFFHCSSGMVDTPLPLDACVISSSPVFGLRTACTMWSMPP